MRAYLARLKYGEKIGEAHDPFTGRVAIVFELVDMFTGEVFDDGYTLPVPEVEQHRRSVLGWFRNQSVREIERDLLTALGFPDWYEYIPAYHPSRGGLGERAAVGRKNTKWRYPLKHKFTHIEGIPRSAAEAAQNPLLDGDTKMSEKTSPTEGEE